MSSMYIHTIVLASASLLRSVAEIGLGAIAALAVLGILLSLAIKHLSGGGRGGRRSRSARPRLIRRGRAAHPAAVAPRPYK